MPSASLFAFHLFVFIQVFSVQGLSQSFSVNPEKLQYAKETEQEAIARKDSMMLSEAYYLYGKAYTFAGDVGVAQSYFLKSLAILAPRGDSFELGRIYCRLSENPKLLQNDDGMKYLKLALGIFKRIGSLKGQVVAYGILGQLYMAKGRPFKNTVLIDSARQCFMKVESLGRQLGDTVAIGEARLKMGQLYSEEKSKAIPYLEKAVQYLSTKSSKRAMLAAMANLAEAYINSRQLEKGHRMYLKGREIYAQNKMSDIELEKEFDNVLIKYYEQTGNSEQALSEYRKLRFKELYQLEKDKNESFLRLQTEYETEKKEALLAVQKRELILNKQLLQTQRNFITITCLLLAVAICLSLLFFRISRKNHRTSQKNEQLVREQNHRVKNNLQMITSLMSMQSRSLADADARAVIQESRLRVQSMAIIQRKLYDGNNLSAINLPDFIPELAEAVFLSCGYENAAQKYVIGRISLDVDRTMSLGLIITELAINACKYAFPDNEMPLFEVNCMQMENAIELTVKDNGPGLDVTTIKNFDPVTQHFKGSTFGMKLLELQVSQLYGDFEFRNEQGAVFSMKFKK